MPDELEIQRWEEDGGFAIVEQVRKEQQQYENGAQSNQFHLQESQRVTAS